jgi:hypothetical protein
MLFIRLATVVIRVLTYTYRLVDMRETGSYSKSVASEFGSGSISLFDPGD